MYGLVVPVPLGLSAGGCSDTAVGHARQCSLTYRAGSGQRAGAPVL